MGEKVNPKTSDGKRGLCGLGMNNNFNKVNRTLEDVVTAHLSHGHHFACVEGQTLVNAFVGLGEAADKAVAAYAAYAAKGDNDLDAMTRNGAAVRAKMGGQVLVLKTLVKVLEEATE